MRFVLLCLVWILLFMKDMWFVGARAMGPFYDKLWILFAIWLATAVAAAIFIKAPILLPLLGCASLICQISLLDSWSLALLHPLETVWSDFAGILLAACALIVYRYRACPSLLGDAAGTH